MRSKKFRSTLITFGMVVAAFIACQVMISTGAMTRSLKGQLVPICAYIVMAVSLNLTVGISGEMRLGHAGFMSVGAFSGIVMAMWLSKGVGLANETVCLLLAILTGGVAAGIAGVLIGIPVLRLRGDYLAIVTLAFGEIIRNVLNCLYISMGPGTEKFVASATDPNVFTKTLALDRVHAQLFNAMDSSWTVVVNGPAGATGVEKIATFGMGFALILFTLFVVLNLINSRTGRAIMATRDNRIAAESVGINVSKYKMVAFVTSAVLAGMAGALYGLNYSTVPASKFKFDTSILILVFVVLGGIGNIRGSVIAAALLTILPELLREFSDYRMLVYAVILIVVMLATNSPTVRQILDMVNPVRKIRHMQKAKKARGGDQA